MPESDVGPAPPVVSFAHVPGGVARVALGPAPTRPLARTGDGAVPVLVLGDAIAWTALVGIPPIQYLAKWRMQIAAELLTGSNANIARIAAETGYGSEESFSRAFKKMVGVAPSAWRRRGG